MMWRRIIRRISSCSSIRRRQSSLSSFSDLYRSAVIMQSCCTRASSEPTILSEPLVIPDCFEYFFAVNKNTDNYKCVNRTRLAVRRQRAGSFCWGWCTESNHVEVRRFNTRQRLHGGRGAVLWGSSRDGSVRDDPLWFGRANFVRKWDASSSQDKGDPWGRPDERDWTVIQCQTRITVSNEGGGSMWCEEFRGQSVEEGSNGRCDLYIFIHFMFYFNQ